LIANNLVRNIGGKTTLLNSLLGELNKIDGSINVHRVIENGFAYVSQESWIQQMSFRDNILFGKTYNEENDMKV
jgi:ABC-type transport system involved in cytochrome bd biosynthesis fused ATPase/permease subunit